MISEMECMYLVPHTSLQTVYKTSPFMISAIRYYDRYLLQKAMSVFEWEMPDTWDKNFVLYNLYIRGFVCVTDYRKYGVIPQPCTISGFNIYYNPAKALISNPYLPANENGKEITLGKNGELLTLTPDYGGICDVVNQYSEMLSNALCAANTNLYNSRMAYLFYAKNKNQAESYKKIYDEIGEGKPAVFIDSQLMKQTPGGDVITPCVPFHADLKANYITSDILEDMRRIEHSFAQKIGLPNANSEKKERLTTDEVNKTDVETVSNVCLWYDMLQKSIERVKELYPDLTLSVRYRFPESLDPESVDPDDVDPNAADPGKED